MKSITIFSMALVTLMPAVLAGPDDPVHFADDNLKQAVEEALGIINPTPTDMLALEELYAEDRGIENLTGIEYAQNLWLLKLEENLITDLSPLSSLTNLIQLRLYRNQISDVSPLSSLTSITELYLSYNEISDISPLTGLTNLTDLSISFNQISDITSLTGLTNLTYLHLGTNQISDISPLSGLTNLERLGLGENRITDIKPLSGLTTLSQLEIYANQFSDIGSLKELRNLENLNLERNPLIIDISPLSNLTNLSVLVLNRCQINDNDIALLTYLKNLTILYLAGNQISDVKPLRVLTNLSWLYLNYNQISDITPLADLTNLVVLCVGKNQIIDIDPLSNLTSLEELYLYKNKIIDIDPLSNLTSLEELYLYENPRISDISPLSGLTSLTHLNINKTKISDISPLSGLINLSHLWLTHTEVSDISALADLKNIELLDIRDNPLEDETYGILSQVRENNPDMILYRIIHVDDDAEGTNDGSSWTDAYKYFQDALAEAGSITTELVEIWVAQGTYTPDKNLAHPDGTGDRETTFQLLNGVIIKGGFAGLDELSPYARDIKAHATTLSGDLDSNDVPEDGAENVWNDPSRAENSYHVVTGSGTNTDAVLDGFTIAAGNSNYQSWDRQFGGGMYNDHGSPTITRCKFTGNYALEGGGAVYNYYSNPTVSRCIFAGNYAYDGGGMLNYHSSPILTSCTFIENYLRGPFGSGAGMDNVQYSSPKLTNCMFVKNSATRSGGGISNGVYSNPILNNCIFIENSGSVGGAISSFTSSIPTLTNCILWGDIPYEIHISSDANMVITYSDIQGGWPGEGNIDADPCFADANNGDYHLKSVAGRWDPNGQSWVKDDISSSCIDTGDPAMCIFFEPNPNGRVINMGAYGGTAEASLSPSGINCISDAHPDYDEWITVGEPLCWCYHRQCHGDVDCISEGRQKYWVSTNDLDILIEAWNKPFTEIEGQTLNGLDLVCADFDHLPQGRKKYRVSTNDLDILIANWNISDQPNPDCP